MAIDLTRALVTESEARTYRGIANTGDTDLLEALIDAASRICEDYCQTVFIRRTVTDTFTLDDITEKGVIYLTRYPVVSVTSIEDQANNSIPATDYWIDKAKGMLHGSFWTVPQDANGWATYWTVTYIAGRFANTAAVDPAVKHAAKIVIDALLFGGSGDSVTRKIGDFSIEYSSGARSLGGAATDLVALPDLAKTLLGPYMSRML